MVGVVSVLGVMASLFWLGLWLATVRHRDAVIRLADLPAEAPGGGWPSLAVVFAARNEEEAVGPATRSFLAQDYPGLEVIAVDDRSTDATGAILDAIAAGEDRLRVVHVRELPGGWLGKTHALQSAFEATSATWLLFSDADVILAPGALRRAVAWAGCEGIDHMAVMFDTVTEHEGERMFLAFFGLISDVYAPRWQVAARASRTYVGVGAFNLVRAEAFHAIGGFHRVAFSVDDDMRLGQALKVAGYASRLVVGRGVVSVRWQVGLAGMIRGLEKNSFAVVDYRLPVAALATLAIVVLGMAPHAGVFVGPWWTRALCVVGIGSVALLLGGSEGQSGVTWRHALTLPIGAFACAIALVRSTWLTLWRGGVRWRDHHYPLAELRAHVRRRNAWASEVWRSTR